MKGETNYILQYKAGNSSIGKLYKMVKDAYEYIPLTHRDSTYATIGSIVRTFDETIGNLVINNSTLLIDNKGGNELSFYFITEELFELIISYEKLISC